MTHVLIVEDDVSSAELMELALQQMPGVDVRWVSNAADARVVLSSGVRFDAIITDVHLPGEDGLSLLRAIRDVPVIVVTGSREPGLRERATAAGARAFLEKPWSAMCLRDTVNSILNEV